MSGGVQVFPFYIVCDVSRSMSGGRLESVNSGLPLIHKEIISDPVVSEKARLGVISFSTEARVELPLSNLADIVSMPVLKAGGQTNYAKAFELAQTEIHRDIESLKSRGLSVLRPCVYFITDGRPGDSWIRARDKWVNKETNRYAPVVMCFGVADADPKALMRLSTKYVFLANKGTSANNALREVMKSITRSVVATSRNNEAGIAIPATGEHFKVFDKDKKED